ncbi:di-heme oxidoredictase family protein [Pannonibacter carbonis]|uniref:di-heme oxidoredictase family protein n=1 Tax=Pannonibacter carbonis TaxID=2067569 RepID=UPI001FCA9AFC|nr:di-heme oxidoredictase family protein [Pannonibacter carbonis]
MNRYMTREIARRGRDHLMVLLCAGALMSSGPVAAQSWSERHLDRPLSFDELREDLKTEAARQDTKRLEELIAEGQRLFEARFIRAEGAGRPMATQAIVPTRRKRPAETTFNRLPGPDASACSGCHNQPVTGGAGDFVANVFVSEGFESADFDTTDPQFSNERGTNILQGAGLVELLAREMTVELQGQRRDALRQARQSGEPVTVALSTKDVAFGKLTAHPDGTLDVTAIDGIDPDLVLRPFSQKGVFASLRQFTVNALNVHHGIQATERFGAQWTGSSDFDMDGVPDEIDTGHVSALVAFQAALPAPGRRRDLPDDWSVAAAEGEKAFADIGCVSCHRPALPLESLAFSDPGPFEGAGTLRAQDVSDPLVLNLAALDWVKRLPRDDKGRVLVPLFGDLKRHRIADAQTDELGNELLGQRFVDRDVFITAELWGVGNTAPYGHRGDITTLNEVILAHGGRAARVRDAYAALPEVQQQSIIAFLRTLEVAK